MAAFALFTAVVGLRSFRGFDLWSFRATQRWNNVFFDWIGELFSKLGGIEFTAMALLVLLSGLFYLGRRMLAGRILIAFLTTSMIEIAMKLWLPQVPLPETFSRSARRDPLVAIDYLHSYPSGHMLRTTILLGVIFLLWKNRSGRGCAHCYPGCHGPKPGIYGRTLDFGCRRGRTTWRHRVVLGFPTEKRRMRWR